MRRRLCFLLCAAAVLVLATERPAGAHGAGGIEATNFSTTLGGVAPALDGVRVRLIDTGSRIELRNDGPEVVVLGDQGEPYLRVGPGGSFENEASPTVASNRRDSHTPAPPGAEGTGQPAGSGGTEQPAGAPTWRKLSSAPVVRWHQHSTHWMEARQPPEVERSPGERHVVFPRWEVALQRGEERSVVFGTLTWVPGPSPAPWFGLMLGSFLVTGAVGLLRRWGRPLAAAMALVLVLDVAHASSVAFSFAGGLGTHLAKVVTGSFYGMVGWFLAALAIRLLLRGKVDGLYAAVFAGLSIAVFGGLLDLATLSRSTTPSALPLDVARLCVAVTAGAGLGIAAACLLVIQRTPDARRVVGAGGDADGSEAGGSDEGEVDPRPGGPEALGVGGRSEPPG